MKNLTAALIVAGSLARPLEAENKKPVSLTVDAVASEADGRSFGRPNISYKFLGADAYTFIEMYSDDKIYFGKTMLSKKVGTSFSATGEYVFGNDAGNRNRVGFGVKYSPPMPKNSELSVKVMPLWLNSGGRDKNTAMAGYSGSVSLPAGLGFSSFGECNLAAEKGPQWGYGEAFLGRKIGKHLSVNAGVLLRDKSGKENRLTPGFEKAARISYSF